MSQEQAKYIRQLEHENEVLRKEVRVLTQKLNEQSWITSPDRMGGQFSQDEVDDARTWK